MHGEVLSSYKSKCHVRLLFDNHVHLLFDNRLYFLFMQKEKKFYQKKRKITREKKKCTHYEQKTKRKFVCLKRCNQEPHPTKKKVYIDRSVIDQ